MNFLHFDGLNFKFPKKPLKITFFEWSPPTEILSGISILTFYLALYLTYIYWLIDWLVGWLVDWLIDWHFIWHIFWHSIFWLAFYLVSGISSDILSHILCDIWHSQLKSRIPHWKNMPSQLRSGSATWLWRSPLRSGSARWDLELAAEGGIQGGEWRRRRKRGGGAACSSDKI